MNYFKRSFFLFLVMTLLTGLIYPLFMTMIAGLTMQTKADGSLIQRDGKVIGSLLIAQDRKGERYFWPRPSAIDYNPMAPSGGSNLGPTSVILKDLVNKRKELVGSDAPAELLYASGSGLDPHISLECAYFQMQRISQARHKSKAQLKLLIDSFKEGNQLGFLGASYVNVFLLNQALDEQDAR